MKKYIIGVHSKYPEVIGKSLIIPHNILNQKFNPKRCLKCSSICCRYGCRITQEEYRRLLPYMMLMSETYNRNFSITMNVRKTWDEIGYNYIKYQMNPNSAMNRCVFVGEEDHISLCLLQKHAKNYFKDEYDCKPIACWLAPISMRNNNNNEVVLGLRDKLCPHLLSFNDDKNAIPILEVFMSILNKIFDIKLEVR